MNSQRVLQTDKLGPVPRRDKSWSLTKTLQPVSQSVQHLVSLWLFAVIAWILLSGPVDQPFEILLQHGLRYSLSSEDIRLHLAAGLAAWLVCLLCLKLLWQRTNSISGSVPFGFLRYLLFAFISFFVVERITCFALPWPQPHRIAFGLIQVFSSITTILATAILLPHLRSTKEGSAIAQREHDRFLAAAESSLDDFYIFDGIADSSGNIVDFRFSYINPNAERRLQANRDSLIGMILTEVRPFMITSGLIEKYREVVRTGVPFTCEVFLDDDMIKDTWLNVQVVKLGTGIAITSRDVTERKRLTDYVHNLAHYDQLTGLANRTLLQERLKEAIVRAQSHNQKIAVFMLDIDHFKRINDSLGHAEGDLLLTIVAKRLLSSVRKMDTVARMGGDEFVIVMPEFESIDDVKRCGLKIIRNAAQPVILDHGEINITVSIGVCIYPDCGIQADDLLKNADAAMYVIKETGRNGLHIFDDEPLPGQEMNPMDA